MGRCTRPRRDLEGSAAVVPRFVGTLACALSCHRYDVRPEGIRAHRVFHRARQHGPPPATCRDGPARRAEDLARLGIAEIPGECPRLAAPTVPRRILRRRDELAKDISACPAQLLLP